MKKSNRYENPVAPDRGAGKEPVWMDSIEVCSIFHISETTFSE